jgi:transposase
VIGDAGSTRVFVHREPVDLRRHFDGLWGIAATQMQLDPFAGALFVFLAKSRRRAKVLWWDGTGVLVLCKRLDKGLFIAPWQRPGTGPLTLTRNELALLLEGCEHVARITLSPEPWTPVQVPPDVLQKANFFAIRSAPIRLTGRRDVSLRRRPILR